MDGDVWTRPSWIAFYGDVPADGGVVITFADDVEPSVRTLGTVWAAEWIGLAQPLTIRFGRQPASTITMRRPQYLP